MSISPSACSLVSHPYALPFDLSSINPDLCGTEGGGIAWLCPGNVENMKI